MTRLLLTAAFLNGLFVALLLPDYPDIPWIAAEALLLAGIFSLLPRSRIRSRLAMATGALYAMLALWSLCDLLVRQSLGRSLNLYLELGKVRALFNLLETNLGPLLSVGALALLLLLLAVLAAITARLLDRLDYGGATPASRRGLFTGGALALVLAPIQGLPVGLTGSLQIRQQVSLALETHATTREFRAHLQTQMTNRTGTSGGARPLRGLDGANLILGFMESYGVSAWLDPRYRDRIGDRLTAMETGFTDAGLHIVSGRLTAPVQGGQSWLAHATLLSGQWVNTQLDYEILLASDYPTLIDDMRLTGYETVAIMPAITRAWPEGRQLGYDRIHDSMTMDYKGPALNWVTMPDQYTWSWFQRAIVEPAEGPVFAEIALISSHAPWVPILPVLDDWQSIGDGGVFEPWRDSGESPASLWQDTDRVRDHYARAIDYALAVVIEYALRHLDDNSLLMILGDHQPAPLITGDDASQDAMVHLISANPALLEPFIDTRNHQDSSASGLPGFQRGARPAANEEGAGMDSFRPFLHCHFSAEAPTPETDTCASR